MNDATIDLAVPVAGTDPVLAQILGPSAARAAPPAQLRTAHPRKGGAVGAGGRIALHLGGGICGHTEQRSPQPQGEARGAGHRRGRAPRILFNSSDAASPAGLSNDNGRVGLALQDNPKAVLSTSLWKLWGRRRGYDIGYGDLLILMSRGKLPDGSSFPFIGHGIHGIPDVPHYLTGMGRFPPALKVPLARMMFYSNVTLGLFCAGEVVPGNRVRPGRTQDRYGVRHVDVDFAVTDTGRQRMDAMLAWGRTVLRRASSTLVHASVDNSGTGIHSAGTTPMSADPAAGTVDTNLRSHEIDNLYICDGGVIPFLPDKHLTLTIMALSDRLGDHLIDKAHETGDRLGSAPGLSEAPTQAWRHDEENDDHPLA